MFDSGWGAAHPYQRLACALREIIKKNRPGLRSMQTNVPTTKGSHLTGTMVDATFVAGAMPTSTLSVLLAQQYGAYEAEIAGMMLLTTVGMLVLIPASMALCPLL
jgi:hypothetical protein